MISWGVLLAMEAIAVIASPASAVTLAFFRRKTVDWEAEGKRALHRIWSFVLLDLLLLV